VTKTTLVYFRVGELERPVLKVEERDNGDVTIVVRSERDEHLSLHPQADKILLTHYAPDIASSTHDERRIEVARTLGYRDPERHGSYVAHWPLRSTVIGMDGHELVGRRIHIDRATPRGKYDKLPRIVIDAPAAECMVWFVLSTPEQPYSRADEPHVSTGLGDLYFRVVEG
jgi:hypothetical protein